MLAVLPAPPGFAALPVHMVTTSAAATSATPALPASQTTDSAFPPAPPAPGSTPPPPPPTAVSPPPPKKFSKPINSWIAKDIRQACKITLNKDDMDTIARQFKNFATTDSVSRRNFTALHAAASAGAIENVRWLLKAKANVNTLTKCKRRSALYEAVAQPTPEAVEIVKLLLQAGASTKFADPRARCALDRARQLRGGCGVQLARLVGRVKNADKAPCRGCCHSCFEETELYRLENCGHSACMSCLSEWLKHQVKNEFAGLHDLKCMDPSCCGKPKSAATAKHSHAPHIALADAKTLLDSETWERCNQITLEKHLTSSPGFRWCTRCDAGGIVPKGCDKVPCSNCKTNLVASVSGFSEHRRSDAWKNINSKDCPKCGAPTQKNGGCSHITCRVCRYEWCWICMGKYQGRYTTLARATVCPCR